MPSFLLLLFSNDRRVRSVETVLANDIDTACERAQAILQGQNNTHGYELWLAGKKMASYFLPAAESGRKA
jgi:hypothetical protein